MNIKYKQRGIPSLFRERRGEEKRKRKERFLHRQKTLSFYSLITNVINFRS